MATKKKEKRKNGAWNAARKKPTKRNTENGSGMGTLLVIGGVLVAGVLGYKYLYPSADSPAPANQSGDNEPVAVDVDNAGTLVLPATQIQADNLPIQQTNSIAGKIIVPKWRARQMYNEAMSKVGAAKKIAGKDNGKPVLI